MNVGELMIRIGADTGDLRRGVREARREVGTLPNEHVIHIRVDNSGGGLGGMNRSFGDIRVKIAAIVSSLPLIAAGIQVAAGAAGGLASMLGAATLGTAGFASVAIANLNDVFDAQKQITKANQDMATASTAEEQKSAMEALSKAYKGLNEGQLMALNSMQKFKSFWDDFQVSFQAPVIVAFSMALDGLRSLLENIGPAIKATGNAIVTMFQRANEAMKGSDFTTFFSWLEKNVGRTIVTFGTMFMNTMQGVINLMVAFQPVSDQMQGGFVGMTQAFLEWTQGLGKSETFKEFLAFVIDVGPQFIALIKNVFAVLVDLIYPLSMIGRGMLIVINIILGIVDVALKAFNAFTALALGFASASARVNDLTNALRQLFGFQAKTSNAQADAIIDVDKAYKDMFGNVTSGFGDAKKAAQGFLASFDEVHSIPIDKGISSGVPTLPTVPTLPSGGGSGSSGGSSGGDVGGGTDWLQTLIDKLKNIPPLIPMRFDPPDAGGGAVATAVDAASSAVQSASANMVLAFQAVINKMNELPSVSSIAASVIASMTLSMQVSATSVQLAWHEMLDYMQVQLNAYSPYLTFGWDSLMLTLGKLTPTSETASAAWHTMLDYMQSQLNAYRPYLEYGISLVGISLSGLVEGMKNAASAWSAGWQSIMSTISTATSPIVSMIDSIRASYASLMAMMGQPIVIPPIQLPAMPKIDIPSLGSIGDVFKNIGSGYVDAMDSLSKTAFMKWIAAHPDIGSSVGAGGALNGIGGALEAGGAGIAAKLKAIWDSLQGSGLGGAVTGFAGGGIIGSDSIVRVGEQGRQEAIIPLGGDAMQPFANAIASNMGGGSGGGNGDIVLQIDGVTFARITAPYSIKESARIGGSMITAT